KRTDQCDMGAEDVEKIGRDEGGAELVRCAVSSQRDGVARPDSAERLERARALAKPPQVWTGQWPSIADRVLAEPDEDETIGIAIRQRVQQRFAHGAESRGVGADASRE